VHGGPCHLGHLLVKSIQDSQEPCPRGQEHGLLQEDVSISSNVGFRALASLHSFRYGCSCHGVDASTEKGKGGGVVKYGTARKARSTLTVLWESSPLGGNDMTLSAGSVKGHVVATRCPSEGQWYQHFETGICARMGDVVTQDRAYTIEVLLALLKMYKEEWQMYYLQMPLLSICACMFLLVSCLGGMQGFEVVWTDLAALRYDIAHCESAKDDLAVSWPIVGRFKGRHGILDCFMIPIAGVTSSGIQFFTLTQRFLRQLGRDGFEDGWAFQRPDGSRAKASDYQENICWKLEIIQATTSLIDPGCSIV
jgi:hypothetical protein